MTPTRRTGRLPRIARWRPAAYFWRSPDRNSCLKCGFLTFQGGGEVTISGRRLISAKGQLGWFSGDSPQINCFKNLWDWEFRNGEFDTMITEPNEPRRYCIGFCGWQPGRSPEEHLKLEDERRGFQHQRRLAWLAFFGALFGSLLGAGVAYFTGRPGR
jgi:hypothetical protein